MRIRTGFTTGLTAAALLFGAAIVYPQGSPDGANQGANQGCPPSGDSLKICLTVRPINPIERSVDPAAYGYPFHDPYVATMTGGMLNPNGVTKGVEREVIHVPGLPGRDQLPLLKGRGAASVALYRQHRPAPLVFILSGIGSNPYFGPATYYAALLHKEGAHVVVLPSPMTWNFALAVSRSGAPGYAPDDARDIYQLMQAMLPLLRSRYGLQVTRVDFMGLSLGALEGAYVSILDAEEGKVGIERYLLVNPPIDLSYALGRLIRWDALDETFGKARAAGLRARALNLVDAYTQERRDDPGIFARAGWDFSHFSTEELQYLISQYIRIVLPELVYVTQALHEQHLLVAPREEGRKRLREGRALSLKDYEEKIALPLMRLEEADADAARVNERGSLTPIVDRLRGNPRVHIMHNADDILVDRASLEGLKAIMGSQMTIYPYGGHLGNLWYPENQERIVAFFRASLGPGAASLRGAASSPPIGGSASLR